jgi:DTW domain-containing protein YfiP
MDKITYLKKKELEKEQAVFQRETFCYRCYKLQKNCLCEHIISFDPLFRFVILLHPMEARKEKMGTGRITHAFLNHSKIITGVDFTNNDEVNELIEKHNAYVLYPGENALNISTDDCSQLKNKLNANEEIVIFVIDGTWPCAKKMMKLSKNLHNIPRISFTVEKESMFEIKEQPSKFCLSTIESIHLMLDELKRRNIVNLNEEHHQMLVPFKHMVEFQKQCAQNPDLDSYRRKKGFKSKEERKPSKKWETRSILFRGN